MAGAARAPAPARWPGLMCQPPGHCESQGGDRGLPLSCPQQVSRLIRRCFGVVPTQGSRQEGGWELRGGRGGHCQERRCGPASTRLPMGMGIPAPPAWGPPAGSWERKEAAGHPQGPRQPAGGRSACPPVSLAAVEPVNYSRGLSSPCRAGGRAPSSEGRNPITPRELRWPGAMALTSFAGAGGLGVSRERPASARRH